MMQLELFPELNKYHPNPLVKHIYGCHSEVTPKRLPIQINEASGEQFVMTRHVVQDGYVTPHPLLAQYAESECNRVPKYEMCVSKWLPVRCGHIKKDEDVNCIGCECLNLPAPNKKV